MSISLAMIFDSNVLFDVLLFVLLIAETCRSIGSLVRAWGATTLSSPNVFCR